ncbi:hypothetical protein HKW98_18480 [Stutzerimonas urumqiensis]|uniref:hypothetical protein n=1 Tax=Stutzerimonas urumqiensis TaxID=638269 RepID=UPI003BAA6AAF
MTTCTLDRAQAIAARSGGTAGKTTTASCGRTLHMGFFFDGFARNLEHDRAEDRISNIGRLFLVHPRPESDGAFDAYRKVYFTGLGADYSADGGTIAGGVARTLVENLGDIPKDLAVDETIQGGKDLLDGRNWWERLGRTLDELADKPQKGVKVLRDAAIGSVFEGWAPLRDTAFAGMLMKSGADTRLEGALARFHKDVREVKGASNIPLRWIRVSVFGFDFGATLARAFLHALLKEDTGGAELQLVFAGLFDGVDRSAGSNPILEQFLPFRNDLDDGGLVPKQVQSVLHLIAAHERRFYRRARLLGSLQRGWREQLMPGVSEDIGGGLAPGEQKPSAELALASLHRMYRAAHQAGVPFIAMDQLAEADVVTAELFVFDDKVHGRSAAALAERYLRIGGHARPGRDGFTVHMRLYIRWLAALWYDYQASLKRLADEEDRLHANQYGSGKISGLLGLPREDTAQRQLRLERTEALREERRTLRQQLSWLDDVDEEARSLRNRHHVYGLQAAGGDRHHFAMQATLLDEWFAPKPARLDPGIDALFRHFVHDKLALSTAQRTARSLAGENYFAIRGFDVPDSEDPIPLFGAQVF